MEKKVHFKLHKVITPVIELLSLSESSATIAFFCSKTL